MPCSLPSCLVWLMRGGDGEACAAPALFLSPVERSITLVLQDFMDPSMFYLPLPAYYYEGEGPASAYGDCFLARMTILAS